MTLTEIQTLLRLYINDQNSERWSDANLLPFINRAQADIQNLVDEQDEHFFSACKTYSVVADRDGYEFTLPTDCKRIMQVERLTTTKPVPCTWVEFGMRHVEPVPDTLQIGSLSSPRCYLRGTKVGVVAPADSYTLRMWYIKRLTDLSAGGDVSEIPLEFHGLLALHAARMILLSEGRDFEQWEKEYNEGMARIPMSLKSRQQHQPRYVHCYASYN